MSSEQLRVFVDELFREQALSLGGLIETHALGDEAVWSMMRSMDWLRKRALSRLAKPNRSDSPDGEALHPAIATFLSQLEPRP